MLLRDTYSAIHHVFRDKTPVRFFGQVNQLRNAAHHGVFLAERDSMDDARLRQLAERFSERASAAHRQLSPSSLDTDGEFWRRRFLEFAQAVMRETPQPQSVRDQICKLATEQYERLPPREKMLGVGRTLHTIAELAKAK